MEIRKTFRCPSCQRVTVLWVRPNDDDPFCPYGCEEQTQWQPGTFAIGTHKGKAIDITQRIVEEDFGVTNMSDSQREGDIAYKQEPETQAKRQEKEQIVDQVRTSLSTMAGQQAEQSMRNLGMKSPAEFWGSGKGFQIPAATAIASVKGTVTDGNNPMRLLHKGIESGEVGEPVKRFRPLAKA